jgi:hypothetical protein
LNQLIINFAQIIKVQTSKTYNKHNNNSSDKVKKNPSMIYLDNAHEDEQYTNRKVFDTDFKVEEMSNPSKYLV